ncbi:hypothetical protein ACFFWC_18490 [Plantactinospora siamensis]|uniref:DUF4352 domain-containing protein n=1 Tax=Plantactinospora siamensis TaxID=555372 RepID=A0ABV6NQ85_9ACTN
MPEPTAPLDAEFEAFRAAVLPCVAPAGPDAVRRTVRRRRRTVMAVAAATGLALVVGPVAAYAALDHKAAPTPAGTATPAPTATTGSPTPSAGPTSGSPSAAPTSEPPAPDGRIGRAQLLRTRLDLPPWPARAAYANCATRHVRVIAGQSIGRIELMDLLYADVDADGAQETVVTVGCRPGEAAYQQVVALDRDSDGNVVTLGQVARTETLDPAPNEIAWITAVADNGPGSLRVQVADLQPCCSTPEYWARKQWRTYGWTGHGFRQTAGPTGWGPDTRLTDLVVTAGPLAYGPPDTDGKRHGSLAITVTNKGPLDADYVVLDLSSESATADWGKPDGGAWSACGTLPKIIDHVPTCVLPKLAAGEQRSYTFPVTYQDPPPAGGLKVRVMAERFDSSARLWKDLNPADSDVVTPVRFD